MKKKVHIDDVFRGFIWGVLLAFTVGAVWQVGRMVLYPRPEYAQVIKSITQGPDIRR